MAASVYRSTLPLKGPLLGLLYVWRKAIEITTGICLPHRAVIGPGLCLNHFGPIIVNKDAVIGADCDIAQCVTIGVSGHGARRGVPVIGNHVYIGPCATVSGKIVVGDGARISGNSLVISDVPPGALVSGVPARMIRRAVGEGSDMAECGESDY